MFSALRHLTLRALLPLLSVSLLGATLAGAQTFNCGSTGSDGALSFPASATPVTHVFDPKTFNPPLDPDGDGVYHFTTVNIPANVTVKIRAPEVGWVPLHWLCTGNVTIAGKLDLDGEAGHPAGAPIQEHVPSIPGPGGFPGGWGCVKSSGLDGAHGFGSGSGNVFCQPLRGGNGNRGDGPINYGVTNDNGQGGGAGGGALLLASNTAITVTGIVSARFGLGYQDGTSGAIRLLAPTIGGDGRLDCGRNKNGWYGYIRLEATNDNFSGTIDAGTNIRRVTLAPTATTILPQGGVAKARLVRINGVAVPGTPSGLFVMPPDVEINTDQTVTFEVEASGIPLGTKVTIFLWNETEQVLTFDTAPLEGSVASSMATGTRKVPNGWSRGFIYAQWTQ
ncbi:MAG: hypothetical protein RLY93_09210 [Sumerlaeia bacterium]